jgi:hypothetical protein
MEGATWKITKTWRSFLRKTLATGAYMEQVFGEGLIPKVI